MIRHDGDVGTARGETLGGRLQATDHGIQALENGQDLGTERAGLVLDVIELDDVEEKQPGSLLLEDPLGEAPAELVGLDAEPPGIWA